mmetsp:Transcript_35334/g.110450  ORF Transcript_35334/g.110450 Transcript_35334/m.110450 type:complete len:200 (-) Transcript_35334:402-1001(-)
MLQGWPDPNPSQRPPDRHAFSSPWRPVHNLHLAHWLRKDQTWTVTISRLNRLDFDEDGFHGDDVETHDLELNAPCQDGVQRVVRVRVHEGDVNAVLYPHVHLDGRVVVIGGYLVAQELHSEVLLVHDIAPEATSDHDPQEVSDVTEVTIVRVVGLLHGTEVEIELVLPGLQATEGGNIPGQEEELILLDVIELWVFNNL